MKNTKRLEALNSYVNLKHNDCLILAFPVDLLELQPTKDLTEYELGIKVLLSSKYTDFMVIKVGTQYKVKDGEITLIGGEDKIYTAGRSSNL